MSDSVSTPTETIVVREVLAEILFSLIQRPGSLSIMLGLFLVANLADWAIASLVPGLSTHW